MADVYKCKFCKKEVVVGFLGLTVYNAAEDEIIKKYGNKELKRLIKLCNKKSTDKLIKKVMGLTYRLTREERKEEFLEEVYKRKETYYKEKGEDRWYREFPKKCPKCKKQNWEKLIEIID